jgi:hypothetical protein
MTKIIAHPLKVVITYKIESKNGDHDDIREELDLAISTTMLLNGYFESARGLDFKDMTRNFTFVRND